MSSLLPSDLDEEWVKKAYQLKRLQMQLEMRADPVHSRYVDDPVGWARDVCGVHLWSKQSEVCKSVVDHRFTAVKSGHGVGKSFTACVLACWWLSVHPPGTAFLVTSAPSFAQVRGILWREIRRLHARAKLPGRVNQTEWLIGDTIVGFGRKPQDTSEDAFQGIHSDNVLVLLDEAAGIVPQIWEASETLMTNQTSRIMAIGNPDRRSSHFHDICFKEPGWNVVTISAFDSPAYTGEKVPEKLANNLVSVGWVEERRAKWREGSPLWQSKVLGEFPDEDEDGVIPMEWVRQCQDMDSAGYKSTENSTSYTMHGRNTADMIRALRETKDDPWIRKHERESGRPARFVDDPAGTPNLNAMPGNARRKSQIVKDLPVEMGGSIERVSDYGDPMIPIELGLDVGGGTDKTVIWERRGKVACRVWRASTQESASVVNLALNAIKISNATSIKVDTSGMGWGVSGHLEDLYKQGEHTCTVVPVQVSQNAKNPDKFDRLRDEIWWEIGRKFSETLGWDLTQLDDDIISELTAPTYEITRYGRIKVESKQELRKRLKRSTDDADALLLAFYSPAAGRRKITPAVPISIKQTNYWKSLD